ncbi:MAG: glycoside hydrolase family 3 C-terminal domain-containing protein [Chitinispirillaceae bacterium]|nr:glycoside hydrolase family 3 C-terminal domain-containing protein [Chitinispirillaceae bacterium]
MQRLPVTSGVRKVQWCLCRNFLSGLSCLLVFAFAAFGQSGDFTTRGRVVTSGGAGIADATITYTNTAKRLSWDFSDPNGYFGGKVTVVRPKRSKPADRITLAAGPLDAALFDLGGRRIASLHTTTVVAGSYLLEQAARRHSRSLFIVKVKTGGTEYCRRMLAWDHTGFIPSGNAFVPANRRTGLIEFVAATAIDTIRIGKTGYTPVKVPVGSYTADVGSVTLNPVDIEARVNALFGRMTQAEKVGQLVMPLYSKASAEIAAADNLGCLFGGANDFSMMAITALADMVDSYQNAMLGTTCKIPVLFGFDGVHGMNSMKGGTLFPHNMGMGAIQDLLLVQKAFRVAAIEMRATGANWTFAPCVAVPRDDRWGRAYEGFSESPDLTRTMARHAILGLQTTDLSLPVAVAATTKHFAGDGGTADGKDRGNTTGDDATLRAIHLAGYEAAIAAGTATIMPSFSSWNGIPMHRNPELLTAWLKNDRKFDGFIVGDWEGHSITGGTSVCVNAGLDVPMAPNSMAAMIADFNDMYGGGSGARCDDAVKRVLRVKYRMDLFTNYLTDRKMTALIGCEEHRDVARACVRNSLVLLKNDNNTLPIPKSANVAVWGPHGDDIGLQCGAWTVTWQGAAGNVTTGTTIRQGVQSICTGNVGYSAAGDAGSADYIIVCIGEKPYSEVTWTHIDLDRSPGYATNSSLVSSAKATGKKVIAVLITGRPLDISTVIGNCDAFVVAWLPGTEGKGIAEVLFRDKPEYTFTGRLPFTWPKDITQEPVNAGDGKTGLFAFGYGLSY